MKYAKTLLLPLLATVSILVGCSSTPEKFIFSPNYTQSAMGFSQPISLTVNDTRPSFTTVTIKERNGTRAIANNELAPTLTRVFNRAIKSNASDLPSKSVTVNISQLQTVINQQLHKHTVQSNIALDVIVQSELHQFSKRYTGNQKSEGPLGYDKANIEQQVNRLLEDMIYRIGNDAEFINAVNR